MYETYREELEKETNELQFISNYYVGVCRDTINRMCVDQMENIKKENTYLVETNNRNKSNDNLFLAFLTTCVGGILYMIIRR